MSVDNLVTTLTGYGLDYKAFIPGRNRILLPVNMSKPTVVPILFPVCCVLWAFSLWAECLEHAADYHHLF
jgi:hypothetical protein